MPILPLERTVFPEDLFTRIPSLGEDAVGRWWVVHTRPRAEKALARRLHARDVAFFLPLHQRPLRVRGRLIPTHVPLFPGYLCLHGEDRARLAALEANAVVRFLAVDDQRRLHDELQQIHQLTASGAPLTPEDRLQPGMPVQITEGPFAGLEGKVLRRGQRWKVCVEIELLQRGVSVELESWMVQTLAPLPTG